MTRMIVIWGTTYCALIKQALVGAEEGMRMMMMTDDNDSIRVSIIWMLTMCHTLCQVSLLYNLLPLERQILLTLCPFCSWGNWGLGRCHKPHSTSKSSRSRLFWLHSVYKAIELDPLKFLSISFTPQRGSSVHVHIQFWEFTFQPQEGFGVVNTLSEYRHGGRKPSNQKRKDFSKNFCKKWDH